MRSPLTQGGIEIPCKIKLSWSSRTGIAIFSDFVIKNYDLEKNLVDDSPTILREIKENLVSSTDQEEDDTLYTSRRSDWHVY